PNNGPVTVDAQQDTIDKTILVHPQLNWDMVTGDLGSIIKIIRINLDSLNNATASLYYHDATSGTADGTPDTGDGVSFGDVGLQLSGTDINGLFPIFIESVFLPGRQTPETAALLRDQVDQPLQKAIRMQAFDAIPPAAIADLSITESTDFTLSLEWTAPGDDSLSNGPAVSYTLYYSTMAPGDNLENWRQYATAVTEGLPTPAEPGTQQAYTLEGLEAGKAYYIALTATDDFGNESPLTTIVQANTTVPVQLVAFRAEVDGNQVSLFWQTASEINNAGFFVDRRAESSEKWQQVAYVKGNGTNENGGRYEWSDRVQQPGVYFYRLRPMDADGRSAGGPQIRVNVTVPRVARLYPNYPNPFRQGQPTVIQYDLPAPTPEPITLRLFNVLGQELGVLYRDRQSAGYYQWQWDGRLPNGQLAAPGIYFLILETGHQQLIRKLAILPF
ncbi:MAG: T9SS type A sorting domain-containing protein, partial [candidate division KSB1 bacterium]|nr:T9SS type A sorting domain-containing protein [candidate division KSB1 bacterium]